MVLKHNGKNDKNEMEWCLESVPFEWSFFINPPQPHEQQQQQQQQDLI